MDGICSPRAMPEPGWQRLATELRGQGAYASLVEPVRRKCMRKRLMHAIPSRFYVHAWVCGVASWQLTAIFKEPQVR